MLLGKVLSKWRLAQSEKMELERTGSERVVRAVDGTGANWLEARWAVGFGIRVLNIPVLLPHLVKQFCPLGEYARNAHECICLFTHLYFLKRYLNKLQMFYTNPEATEGTKIFQYVCFLRAARFFVKTTMKYSALPYKLSTTIPELPLYLSGREGELLQLTG
jgi:hypothetical protein